MNNVASVVKLLEGFDLETGRHTHALLLELADGSRISADVDAGAYRQLERAYVGNYKADPVIAGSVAVVPPDAEELIADTRFEHAIEGTAEVDADLTPEQEEALQQEVQWDLLPEEMLLPLMKQAMKAVQIRPVLKLSEVYEVAQELHESLTAEDWEKLRRQAAQSVLKAPPASAPTWTDGTPIVPRRSPGRRVEADERGNPLVASQDVDPGEMVGGAERDEDGVASW